MGAVIESPFMTESEAADFLKLKAKTLRNMRWRGEGGLTTLGLDYPTGSIFTMPQQEEIPWLQLEHSIPRNQVDMKARSRRL